MKHNNNNIQELITLMV